MNLVKTSILSFIATAVKMASAFVINKTIAMYIGPTGLALVGQYQNFSQLITTIAQGAINTGVTKYTAEYSGDNESITNLISTAARISLFFSFIVASGLLIFSKFISLHLFQSDEFNYIFIISGLTIFLFVANNLLLSILNGLKEVKLWVKINIIQSLYGLFFTSLLIVYLGFDGALIALATNQSVTFFILIWMLKNHQIINFSNFKKIFDKIEAKKLGNFALMAVTSAVATPVSHIMVRSYIGENIGWDEAGYWQAIRYISNMYLMVITTTLGIYYLPRLSEIIDKAELRKELFNGYKFIMPIVVTMAISIFFFKDFVIWFVFTETFLPMRELFLWQMLGDVIKISSFLIGYITIAKAMTKTYIFLEIFGSISFVTLSVLMLDKHGLIGVTYAYAINYSLYFIILGFILTKNKIFY